MNRVLAVRLDSDGDVLITGPAIRALANTADRLDVLVSPAGRAAAELLPGIVRAADLRRTVDRLSAVRCRPGRDPGAAPGTFAGGAIPAR